jgi:F0F1-type ATP synthase assembly protein I
MRRKDRQSSQKSQSQKTKTPQNDDDDGNNLKNYARYSGMVFQMIAIIGIMAFVGVKLDERRGGEKPIFTAILSLLGVLAALYTSLKDFIGKK